MHRSNAAGYRPNGDCTWLTIQTPGPPCSGGGHGEDRLPLALFIQTSCDVWCVGNVTGEQKTPGWICFSVSVLTRMWTRRCWDENVSGARGTVYQGLRRSRRRWAYGKARDTHANIDIEWTLIQRWWECVSVSFWRVYMLSMSMCNIVVSVVFFLTQSSQAARV